ncbi:MAG: hypothetical protein ABIQ47_08195 [Tepidiformaceae bacterium]
MPTFDAFARFWNEYGRLGREQKREFLAAKNLFVADFLSGQQPRHSLRVKRVQNVPGVLELSWASDGRATFEYGSELIEGQPHIIWRRIGSHDIFRNP